MNRRLLAAALLLASFLWGAPTNAGGYSGYFYPSGSGSTACSPICDGVRATIIAPTPVYAGAVGELADIASIWIGISGFGSHGTQCTLGSGTNNPLIQFGIEPQISSTNVVTYRTWYEEYPCNNITYYGSLVINPGDSVTLALLCASNCATSGNSATTWSMTWTNNTTGFSQTRTDTGNWLVFMEHVDVVIELQSAGVNSTAYQPLHFTTPFKWSNVQIHQGGVWGPMSVPGEAPPSKVEYGAKQIKSTANTPSAGHTTNIMHQYGVSPPIDSDNGPSWFTCSLLVTAVDSTPTTPASGSCPYSNFSGTGSVGP